VGKNTAYSIFLPFELSNNQIFSVS